MGSRARVIVIGAGFGGLYATLHLARALPERSAELFLLDRRNFHLFLPMLHEVTSGSVEPRHVVWPIRFLQQGRRFAFERREVQMIDLERKRLMTDVGEIGYDYLVIAPGSATNFFGCEASQEFAFTFKTLRDAIHLRNHIIDLFEQADLTRDQERRRRLLTFVLAGGGCTGVELATEVHDLIYNSLTRYYPRVHADEVLIILAEATGRIIPCVSERLAALGLEKLKRKRIEVRLETPVTGVRRGEVELDGKEIVPTETLIWVAGVKASPLVEGLPIEKDKLGRAVVNEYLELPEFPGVFVIGDSARFYDRRLGALPPTSQVAVQEAECAARNITGDILGKGREPFVYRHRGDLVSLGTRYGIGEIGGIEFSGFFAWFLWRTVFLSKLIGFKNKVRVALDWTIGSVFERDLSRLEW